MSRRGAAKRDLGAGFVLVGLAVLLWALVPAVAEVGAEILTFVIG